MKTNESKMKAGFHFLSTWISICFCHLPVPFFPPTPANNFILCLKASSPVPRHLTKHLHNCPGWTMKTKWSFLFLHGRSISLANQTSTVKGSVFLNSSKCEWCNNSIFMACFLGHCEVIVLEGRQGLVTPQLVILQCSVILERSVFQKCGPATIGPIFKHFLLSPSFNWQEFVRRKNIHYV